MPALPAVPNVIKLAIAGTDNAVEWVNVLHWAYTGATLLASAAADIATHAYTLWTTNFPPFMSNSAVIGSATVTDLSSDTGATAVHVGEVAGTAGTDEIPASAALVIHKTTPRRYRGGHPRTYLQVGDSAALFDSRHWMVAFQSGVLAAYEAVAAGLTGYTSSGTTLTNEVCVSYIDKATGDPTTHRRAVPLVQPITGYSTDDRICAQRRRLGKV
jgi:hypothetical protein